MGIYIFKSLGYTFTELKLECIRGGSLFNKVHGFNSFTWDEGKNDCMMNLNPFMKSKHTNEMIEAWDKLFYQISSTSEIQTAFYPQNDL